MFTKKKFACSQSYRETRKNTSGPRETERERARERAATEKNYQIRVKELETKSKYSLAEGRLNVGPTLPPLHHATRKNIHKNYGSAPS